MNTESLVQCSSYFSSIMFGNIWNRSSKNYKIPDKKRNYKVEIWFNKKKKQFRRFQRGQNRKLGNLRKFYLLKVLVVYETQNKKNDQKEKTLTLRCGLRGQNVHLRDFQVFDFPLYLKSKTWKPRKVLVYFNFLSFWLHWARSRLNPFMEFQISRPYVSRQISKDTVYKEVPIYVCLFLNDLMSFEEFF